MAKTSWYRSLYWRIGLGFAVFLAAILAAQGLALVWLISRMEVSPGPPPPEVARLVARDLGDALTANPRLDIAQFLSQEYESRLPLVAVMIDGRVVSSDGTLPSNEIIAEIRARLNADPESFAQRERGESSRGPRGQKREAGPGPERFGRGRGPGPRMFAGPVLVNGQIAGVVVVNPRSTLEQLGPTLLGLGVLLVCIGIASAAVVVFGPVRRRLRSLEDAARQVGGGDLGARAREDGGDEVAALAHAFNQMAADLQTRAAELQSADRTRRLLLADVSHELMTPLTAMRGYLETLSMQGPSLDAATRERYLTIVGDETRRVERIVGDLLDLARLEGAGDSFDVQDVPVEGLFGRVVARHERDAAQKRVALTTSIAPGAEIISGDPMRLEQALQNLTANAIRHTPPDGRIDLTAEVQSKDIVITVRDTGSGIPQEHLAHVFDRFYKADPSRTGQPTGSGLGLSIVRAIVERHHGTIAVASSPGNGTTFTIRFS